MSCDQCPKTSFKKFPKCHEIYRGDCQKGNPGNIQNLHSLAHKVMPKFFDGIELDYIHRMAPNKLVTNNWIFSHTRPSGYRIGGLYTYSFVDDTMKTPTVYANVNPATLASNFGVLFFPIKALRIEAELQRASVPVPLETQLCLEFSRPCTTYTWNFYNVNKDAGRSTFSILRSFTSHLALGAELLTEWTQNRIVADTAIAGRYKRYNYTVAATASRSGCDITYWQRLHPKVQMATLLAWNRKTQRAIATVSYQWDFDDAVVRGKLNSEMAVGFSYFRFLSNIPLIFGTSVLYSMAQSRFVFGVKLSLDPSGLRRGD